MNFYTSDSHFDHANIIQLCKRPFATVEAMNEGLVEAWNSVVGKNDNVYHLGDFAFKSTAERAASFASRLNGTIWLCRGNHDEALLEAHEKGLLGANIFWLPLYHELKEGKQIIVLCHYAMRNWRNKERGAWHLYGHSHGGLPTLGKSFDVGVDAVGFKPMSFTEVKERMETL